MNMYVHIIEYPQRGTLYRLIKDLCRYRNHIIFETKGLELDLPSYGELKRTVYIFHSSGRHFPMIGNLQNFIARGYRCMVFIHDTPDYILLKSQASFLSFIRAIQARYNIRILVPSDAASHMFLKEDITATPVQLGIADPVISTDLIDGSLKKCIVTVATNSKPSYIKAKGIDLFVKTLRELNLQSKGLILGLEQSSFNDVQCVKVSHELALKVLSEALLYVQFSRFESYNITAMEAKRLRVPLLVSNIGGHIDQIPVGLFKCNFSEDFTSRVQQILNIDEQVLESFLTVNYNYSVEHETLEQFKRRIEAVAI